MTNQDPTPTAADHGLMVRQIGVTADGAPVFAYRDTTPVVQAAPAAPARPWGAYVALGIGGAVAVSFLAMAAAILAIAAAIGAVSLTICTLVLRSMWESAKADRKAERGR
jgi:hypothetical protein